MEMSESFFDEERTFTMVEDMGAGDETVENQPAQVPSSENLYVQVADNVTPSA